MYVLYVYPFKMDRRTGLTGQEYIVFSCCKSNVKESAVHVNS